MTYNVMPFYNYQYVSCLAGNSIVSVDLSCTEDFQTSDCCNDLSGYPTISFQCEGQTYINTLGQLE